MNSVVSPFRVSRRTLEVLEWPAIQSQLIQRAKTSFGKEYCRTWVPGKLDTSAARAQSEAILDCTTLIAELQKGLPLNDIPDVSDVFRRVERSGTITVEEFADWVRFHKASQGLYHYTQRYAGTRKALLSFLSGIDLLENWSRKFFPLLDTKGEIADSASEDLRALRKLAQDLHKKVQEKLREYLNNPKLAEAIQEFYVTVRDGRYVVPVKTSFRARVPGIIHDVSATEATLFIEPQEVVDANNQLKVVEKEIQIEIARILAAVVEASKEFIPGFRANQVAIARADLVEAAAEWALDWGAPAVVAEWSEAGDPTFDKLRHPVLCTNRKVVANSLSWKEGLVLSGPNTGGKTVLLKSVGCAVCMAWAGLPIPAAQVRVPKTLCGISADIGDDQNMERNLSTFSAHLTALKELLSVSRVGDLVLIDEIATGTSPEEGEPLAQAVLEKLLSAGVRFFITTHYKGLKHFAMSDERVRIAAMAFDKLTRTPTYEVLLDVPGESSALETAEQLGLDAEIIKRARELRGEVSEDFTKAIDRLEKARHVFEEKEQQLAAAQKKAEEEARRLRDQISEYQAKQREGLAQEARDVLKDLQGLRDELSKSVKAAGSSDLTAGATTLFSKLSEAGESIRHVIDDARKGENVAPLAADADVVVDAVLEIDGLGLGTVIEVPKDLERNARAVVVVQVGDLKTRVVKNRLRRPSAEKVRIFNTHRVSNSAARERNLDKAERPPVMLGKISSQNLICDVRGKSREEAMRRVDQALNELFRNENAVITCIHGHGSDRLKDSIRDYLAKERHDVVYRSGSWPGEGGDGVTVIERRM